MTTEHALSTLHSFADMKDGWNGEGSIAPSRSVTVAATAFLLELSHIAEPLILPSYSITPTNDGLIWFEWDSPISVIVAVDPDAFDCHIDDLTHNQKASITEAMFENARAAAYFVASFLIEYKSKRP